MGQVVADQLQQVRHVQATESTFAALRDGRVTTWGSGLARRHPTHLVDQGGTRCSAQGWKDPYLGWAWLR